ncbi:MAG: crossover junction endodeoxyribonuclease RuvC [Myxococcota bacterium]|nr:crossover junction endodeoxyribonuclease RuvC [Myxococcota bacterium]
MAKRDAAATSLRVLGVDPGSFITGWGLVAKTGNGIELEDSGVLRTKRSAPFSERLRQLHEGLSEIIERTKPDAFAIEAVFHAEHARSALQLGHARGVLILAAAQHGLEPFEYPPATVKKAVTGSGSADKEQVLKMVSLLVGTELDGPADRSDAVAVAICHAQTGTFAARLREASKGEGAPPGSRSGKLRRRRG